MRVFSRALTFIGTGLVLVLLHTLPAQAQATRTWVSGVGDDANPCSRTAPCKTFAGAISKTAALGEINAIDAGAFGTVTITKSITINGEGLEAGVLGTATNGITINASATDVVVLRGLDIDGSKGAGASPGLNGIRFLAGGTLHVQKCLIRNFQATGALNGNGILFAPSATSTLHVNDTIISNNGTSGNSAGILIQPTGATGRALAIVENVQVQGNVFGIMANSSSSTAITAVRASVRNTTISHNTSDALTAVTPVGAPDINMFVDGVGILGNVGGIVANGVNLIMVNNSTIEFNGTGVSTINGGTIKSFGNNNLEINSVPGTFTPPNLTPQ